MNLRGIEIFETDKNKKGDLFGRLIGDFFYSLGYDEPRFNIHKSGREIDIEVLHRTEKKIVIAECKAHSDSIGGADLNKFAGVLESERNRCKRLAQYGDYDVIGYFVSISGFKETAIEQEIENNGRFILIDAQKIIKELVAGKILVSIEQAIDKVPRMDAVELMDYADLIASDIGWIWVLYYGKNQQETHFSLIHAEGNPLVHTLAKKIISLDKKQNNKFKALTYLAPKEEKDVDALVTKAKEQYFQYIENECGEIQFEGLPTDKDAGSVKVKLENIFEPLHLIEITSHEESDEAEDEIDLDSERESVGKILSKNTRLAILAKPGGGKSTLIKRIAVAYAFPEKQRLVEDELPNKEFFPIFIRCRELGNKVSSSITDIIHDIPNRAEISQYMEGFKYCISQALQSGNALLLIDGLDEISTDRDRINFVTQLKRFLSTYPNINIITTSRKAGFRAVGGILAHYCKQYEVSNLSFAEIRELSKKWHIAILDDSMQTIKESNELVDQILNDNRIVALAENPLLLTTLLFVKRWAGYLPTKRHILYQEMIKLLLVTWNVEGHEQLDIDETEPQLAYVAFWMTQNGRQTLTEFELKKCLQDARKDMPDILGYTNISVTDFIKRVESRSSLLIMSGHFQQDDNSLVPIYEFLHLSFQEYLTAKAVVDKSLPNSIRNEKSIEILQSYIFKENWKEVIPLIAVLSKRDNVELIQYLIDESKKVGDDRNTELSYAPTLLGSCIANEIQISPALLNDALEWYAKRHHKVYDTRITEVIIHSKFKSVFIQVLNDLFFTDEYDDTYCTAVGGLIGEAFILENKNLDKHTLLVTIQKNIFSKNKQDSCIGLLSLMLYVYEYVRVNDIEPCSFEEYATIISSIVEYITNIIQTDDKIYILCSSWALAWIFENDNISQRIHVSHSLIFRLIDNWLDHSEENFSRIAGLAFTSILQIDTEVIDYLNKIESIHQKIKEKYNNKLNHIDPLIALCLGMEIGMQWSEEEINYVFKNKQIQVRNDRFYKTYAEKFGIKEPKKRIKNKV